MDSKPSNGSLYVCPCGSTNFALEHDGPNGAVKPVCANHRCGKVAPYLIPPSDGRAGITKVDTDGFTITLPATTRGSVLDGGGYGV